jgi:prepilin-type processing-associated H-X9-DG protein
MVSRRSGFTVFQLLVLLAILFVLLGLLLPAVVKTRKSAQRIQSQNNLRQLALACHNYHDTFGNLPPGNDALNYSTVTYLLPFIEQQNVFMLIDMKKPMDDKANDTVRAIRIKVFLDSQDPVETVKENLGATNYLFCAGSQPAIKDNDGVFYQESKTKFTDIADGTSNTILAGETLKGDGGDKAVDVQRQHVLLKADALKGITDDAGVQDFKDSQHIAGDRCASWMDGRFLQGTFTATRKHNDERPDVNCAGAGGLSALRGPEEVLNIAFCDGSVHALKTKIKMNIWKAMSTRAGGEVINPNDF